MNKITLSERDLKGLLSITYAVAKDNTRPILNGVCFNANDVVAIDGHRVAKRVTGKNVDFGNFILKSEDIKEIHKKLKLKNDNVNIVINDNTVEFEIERLQEKISCIMMQGNYVKYSSLLNNNYFHKIDLDKEQLKELKEILKSIKGVNTALQLNLLKDGLVVSNHSEGKTVNKIECNTETDSKNFCIGVNKRFLKQALENYKQCSLYFNVNLSPIYITNISNKLDIKNSLDLVLPVRLIGNIEVA